MEKIIDKDLIESLNDLSNFYHEKNRRNLRSEIEKRSLSLNDNFLSAFREVKLSLDKITDEISSMNDSVEAMKTRLKNTQLQTNDLIQQTNGLQNDCKVLESQQTIAKAFNEKFQLTPAEHQILYGANSRDTNVTSEFFQVLDRVQKIHNDCKILMQSGYQTAALDLMEEMTLHQEGALERLYRWTQQHCRNLDTSNELSSLIIEAMSRLQDRPVLFKYVLDEFGSARRAVLVRNFIDALTMGKNPIEAHSNDPKRYVGDIFAWLHQAIPNEKENLLHLVRNCEKNDFSEAIDLTLSHIAEGVCHPLKVRVETVLNSVALEKNTLILFQVSNLIRFYQKILTQVVKGGQLEHCLRELQKTSEQAYLGSLSNQVKNLLNGPSGIGLEPPPRSELTPPQSVSVLLLTLKEILSVADMAAEDRKADINKIVSTVIDPLLQSVTESASHLPTTDMAVYLLNCLYQMQTTLQMFEYVDDRLERLQGQSEAQLDTLTSEQATSLVTNLNLAPIYALLQNKAAKIEASLLQAFLDKFSTFLELPEMLLLPQVNLLQSSSHRNAVQKRAFNVIISIYKQLYEKEAADPERNVESTFKRTPEQISEILSG